MAEPFARGAQVPSPPVLTMLVVARSSLDRRSAQPLFGQGAFGRVAGQTQNPLVGVARLSWTAEPSTVDKVPGERPRRYRRGSWTISLAATPVGCLRAKQSRAFAVCYRRYYPLLAVPPAQSWQPHG